MQTLIIIISSLTRISVILLLQAIFYGQGNTDQATLKKEKVKRSLSEC